MRRLAAIPLLLLLATPALATTEPYGWTISASSTDPWVNVAQPTFGADTFYLWLGCCDVPDYPHGGPRAQGISSAEFTLISLQSASCQVIPKLFPPTVLVACEGCTCGPRLAARILVLNLPGTICLGPSDFNKLMGGVDCEVIPSFWPIDWLGISTDGTTPPCSDGLLCEKPVAVEGGSWGRLKGLYRW